MSVHFQRRNRTRRHRTNRRVTTTTPVKTCVATSTPADVDTKHANVHTRVSRVGAQNPNTGVPVLIEAHPLLDSTAWETCLSRHPDRTFVDKIIKYTNEGVPISYTGPRNYRVHANWNSAHKHSDIVYNTLLSDVAKGTKAGPFSHPPFSTFIGSPLGVFPRKRPGKYRLIHDLSWPPGQSVNDYISSEDSSVQYISFDDIVQKVSTYGVGALMARLDISDAYKHILVRPEDWDVLGCTWITTDHNNTPKVEFFVDLTLPFGLRSSAKLFSEMAHALKLSMLYNGVSDADQYLDDFITFGPPHSTVCNDNLNAMLRICEYIGFHVNPEKVSAPTTVIEFLGLVIDSDLLEVRVSDERISSVISELLKFYNRRSCTKRELLSLVGKLIFVSMAVKSGRSFVRRIIDLSKRIRHLHHKARLNKACRDDIKWWIMFLPHWNGVSLISDVSWTTNIDMELYTDASDLAAAGYFNGKWFIFQFQGPFRYLQKYNITFRELLAIVIALATWAHVYRGNYLVPTGIPLLITGLIHLSS